MKIQFEQDWQVVQDTFDLGESYGFYQGDFDPCLIDAKYGRGLPFQLSEWRDLPMLGHLQVLLSDDPNYGPELRQYNAAPWWYRRAFALSEDEVNQSATLHFEGVDYYCKVWLNGEYLGEHEGYQAPFSFEVGGKLKADNVLMVKVWSPLEFERAATDLTDPRCLMIVRNMLKGTYEHGDSLIHRDRNPVGIWRPVSLTLYERTSICERPRVDVVLDGDVARVTATMFVRNALDAPIALPCEIEAWSVDSLAEVYADARNAQLLPGVNEVTWSFVIEHPRLWNTWDRGAPNLYAARLGIAGGEATTVRFGVRAVELVRTERETTFYINGEKFYVRGTSYYPETYLSTMSEGRYRRDMELLRRAGFNMVRVHVHMEQDALYDICDELGICVMQDTDFNWVHPIEDEWTKRVLQIVEAEERVLHNHPSIVSWVCLNEPVSPHQPEMGWNDAHNRYVYEQPGPQLYRLLSEKAPSCGIIRASFCENDLLSGDSHNYKGSIHGHGDYTVIDGSSEKFNTEFGFDAPPDFVSLIKERRVFDRLNLTPERLSELQTYQYRYLKYFIEHYRLAQYAPTSGYMTFMFIDCSPSTFYGVYDYSGEAKPKGLRALMESNQPIALILKAEQGGQRISVVNDETSAYPGATLHVLVKDGEGKALLRRAETLDVPANGSAQALRLALDPASVVTVELTLTDPAGQVIARNHYSDPFHHPHHPTGHPERFSHTIGLRLF